MSLHSYTVHLTHNSPAFQAHGVLSTLSSSVAWHMWITIGRRQMRATSAMTKAARSPFRGGDTCTKGSAPWQMAWRWKAELGEEA